MGKSYSQIIRIFQPSPTEEGRNYGGASNGLNFSVFSRENLKFSMPEKVYVEAFTEKILTHSSHLYHRE